MEAFVEMDSADLVNAYVAMQAEGGILPPLLICSEAELALSKTVLVVKSSTLLSLIGCRNSSQKLSIVLIASLR